MNQSENTLPHEREDLGTDLQHQCKSRVQHTSLTQDHKQADPCSLASTLAKLIYSRLVGDPVFTYTNTHSYKYVHIIHTN